MKLHSDFFEKLHENFPNVQEDAVIEGFYKFLKDITIESNIEYPREIDVSSVTGTTIKFTDTKGNIIGVIEPVKKENFNHGIQLRVDDQVLGLFISDEYIATAIAPTPVPMEEGGNPKSIVTLDSFKQLTIYTLEDLGLSFTEDGYLDIDKTDQGLSSVGYVKQQLDALKRELIAMIPTNEDIARLSALPLGSIIIWTSKTIPKGWHICDGTGGTPDMRDRFIIGASNKRDINVIGGTSTSNNNSSSSSKANISNHFHYWGYESGDNCGVFLTSGGLAGVEWSDNNCCDVRARGLLPSKELIEESLSYTDGGHTYHNVLGATMVRWNGDNDSSDENAVPVEQGGMYKKLNTITTLGISNEDENESESVIESLPPFYSVYYIMKLVDYTPSDDYSLEGRIWDTEPTPGSVNPVTSGGLHAYCTNKFTALSDRIDSISNSLNNIPDYTALQKSIEVLKARLDKQYSDYESLVYCEAKPSGTDPVTFTAAVGETYPGYYLFNSLSENTEITADTTKKYAVYRCVVPSECTLQYTPDADNGGSSWTINYTLGKFEFVRWENA